jgi:membrane-associated phospholipid phosphatase
MKLPTGRLFLANVPIPASAAARFENQEIAFLPQSANHRAVDLHPTLLIFSAYWTGAFNLFTFRTSLCVGLILASFSASALGQSLSALGQCLPESREFESALSEDAVAGRKPDDQPQTGQAVPSESQSDRHGLILRSVHRGLEDQKQLYLAPFKPSNLKWDALFLGGAAALFATDMKVEQAVPTTNLGVYHTISAVSLIGTSVTLGSLWAYGIKTHDEHAKETGELELEALANTFLIYAPMQLIAGRERPDEGKGSGRFLVHHSFNQSFPAGHPMFTWAMASVVAHEYPRPWVQLLAYGAATSVSVSRIMGRNHFASDVFVGTALGYFIGARIFHTRCMLGLSKACRQRDNSY